MARRVKNAKSWLEEQRQDYAEWAKVIRSHSPQAAAELNELERDFSAKTLLAHPDRFEGAQGLIKEFMEGAGDIRDGVQREAMLARGGLRESGWKSREVKKRKAREKEGRKEVREAKRVAEGKAPRARRGRTVEAQSGFDPATGEQLFIIDSVKELGDNVAGVTFDIHKVDTAADGIRYRFNVTKRGRSIKSVEGAPNLYDHPDEKKLFKTEEDAYLRARRVIHAALIWYEERRRGSRGTRDKARRGKLHKKVAKEMRRPRGAGISSKSSTRPSSHIVRTGSYEADILGLKVGTRVKEEFEGGEALREASMAKRSRRKGKKVSPKGGVKAWDVEGVSASVRRGKSAREIKGAGRLVEAEMRGGKLRTPKKMRKGNPLFGGPSEPERAAKTAVARYKSEHAAWVRSMNIGKPKFDALMRAYDSLENARANFALADMPEESKMANTRIIQVRDTITSMMEAQGPEDYIDAAYEENPSKTGHQKNGTKFLNKSEKAWDKYCDGLQSKDLLCAYECLILAEQELGYAKDKNGLKQVKVGMKASRSELTSRLKKTDKKVAKKAAKKK